MNTSTSGTARKPVRIRVISEDRQFHEVHEFSRTTNGLVARRLISRTPLPASSELPGLANGLASKDMLEPLFEGLEDKEVE